jgi:hypothetical protein
MPDSRNEAAGLGQSDNDDPCVDHWLEPGAPPEIVEAIVRHATEVREKLGHVGTGGPDCLSTREIWIEAFDSESITVLRVGRTMGPNDAELGGYLVSGETKPRDHHWLAVGPQLTLFDPTWSQFFREFGPPSLDRYIADDGRPFTEWRAWTAERVEGANMELE